ncbi:MAG: formate dehydrogenase accessory sulfurtransferase FdhD [Clostridiales bacterium]|nr:formate dehydrogenase accessory sulfurtransferase FdhD [Clostridiales bacterium]
MPDNEGIVFEEIDVIEINDENGSITMEPSVRNVIAEASLKILVNGMELVSLLCLNQHQEELALGFLYNEGVIESREDIRSISYNEKMLAVIIELREGITIDRSESLRSITTGCGKCYTYINPLKQKRYNVNQDKSTFSAGELLKIMNRFSELSETFMKIGGVHSVLFYSEGYEMLIEDIGRHNCFDKITGILLKEDKLSIAESGMIFVSGRLTSEIITKIIRLGSPVLVSRSTPTTATIRLARQYNITLLGYVRGKKGVIYSCPERLTP